jgi:hypothetical protein
MKFDLTGERKEGSNEGRGGNKTEWNTHPGTHQNETMVSFEGKRNLNA